MVLGLFLAGCAVLYGCWQVTRGVGLVGWVLLVAGLVGMALTLVPLLR